MLDKKIIKEIEKILGKENILKEKEELLCYCYDAGEEKDIPELVIIPERKEQIREVIKIASKNRIPVIPRGSGTNLSGGSVPVKGGIVIVTCRMDKILEIDEENLTCLVQPGVIVDNLQKEVEKIGLFYPPDPSSLKSCTIGGNVAENSGGPRAFKYGTTKNYVLSLEVILSTGEILNTGNKCIKSVSGYDLTSIFIGSEGTLCFFTEILLRLIPLPSQKKTVLIKYDDLNSAASTVSSIIKEKVIPSTCELIDRTTLSAVEEYLKLNLKEEAILLIEVDDDVENNIKKIKNVALKNRAKEIEIAEDERDAEELWKARRACLPALSRLKPTTLLEDVTVPRNRLVEAVRCIRNIADKFNIKIGIFGHFGDGNLHPTIVYDKRDKDETEKVKNAVYEIFKMAVELGGTITGEHGIGISKKEFLNLEHTEEKIEIMRKIKKIFDPENIFNPGKIL